MKKYLVITIDVEPDCSINWKYSDPLSFKGVTVGITSRLQPLFNRYNVTPTYLINNVVLEDQESVDTFKKLEGKFELGTHLHPEFIEPNKQFTNYAGKKGEANCCFYPPEIEKAKIEAITRLFKYQFGYDPTSFRAGRFSASSNTIQSLKKLRYKVDTSVTPNVIWDDRTREKPVDFRQASAQPYWVDDQSILDAGNNHELLEVPLSISLERLSIINAIKYIVRNKRLPYQFSKALWLRPVFSKQKNFENILHSISNKYFERESIVYNMMFHNVEVMPGLSPYSKTEQDCESYLSLLEDFLKYCEKENIESIPLSTTYDIFKK